MTFNIIKFITLFLSSSGVICSYFLASYITGFSANEKYRIFVNDALSLSKILNSGFSDAVTSGTLESALSLLELKDVDSFNTLVSDSINGGITRISLLEKFKHTNESEATLGKIYQHGYGINSSIMALPPEDFSVSDLSELWVVTFTYPPLLPLIGLVVNSEKQRSDKIIGSTSSNSTTILNAIVLIDRGELGLILFHPILKKGKITHIISYVIEYSTLFNDLSFFFLEKYPNIDVNVLVEDIPVFSTSSVYLEEGIVFEPTDNFTVVMEEIENENALTLEFLYLFISGTVISIIMGVFIFRNNSTKNSALSQLEFKSRFISDVSHEIRTPMNGIIGMSDLMTSQPLNDISRFYLNNIRSCGDTLMRIINNVLDMSKIEAGVIDIRPYSVDICNSIENVLETLWTTYRKERDVVTKNLETKIIVEVGVPKRLIIDADRIRQIVSNLFTNAIKFTQEGYITMTISTLVFQGRNHLSLKMKDTGPGIDSRDIAIVFNPFDQAKNRAHDYGGTGLGLSISKKLCVIMGGDISCTSELGKGSLFSVLVPYESDDEVSTYSGYIRHLKSRVPRTDEERANSLEDCRAPRADSLEDSSRAPMPDSIFIKASPFPSAQCPRVLVVDDIEVNRMVLCRILDLIEVKYQTCVNGLEAVNESKNEKYSLIFMDMMMPVMDGIEATKSIRELSMNTSTPIIFISANVQSHAIEMCQDSGGTYFLKKPIRKQTIFEICHKYMNSEENEWCRRILLK